MPCAPINNFAEVLADPHVRGMGWVKTIAMPNGTSVKTVGFPIGISEYDFEIVRTPPKLGEHNDEVLSEWTHPVLAKAL